MATFPSPVTYARYLGHGFKLAGRAILRVEFRVKMGSHNSRVELLGCLERGGLSQAHCFVFSHSSAFFEIKTSTNKGIIA